MARHGDLRRGGRATRSWVAAATAGIIALMVASLAQDPLTGREIQYVFWALVGLMVLRRREADGGQGA